MVVKIPWSNLYGASVEATIEGLYLLLAPNNQVEYNAEKEEQRVFENKIAELQRIDDRKKLAEGITQYKTKQSNNNSVNNIFLR